MRRPQNKKPGSGLAQRMRASPEAGNDLLVSGRGVLAEQHPFLVESVIITMRPYRESRTVVVGERNES
jgi:hypothetical protein